MSLAEAHEHYGVRDWATPALRKSAPLAVRLLRRTAAEGECWIWRGAAKNHKGYGAFWHDDRTQRVHRVAYEFFVGPIEDGLTIDHLCRRTACLRPDHLEPVTAAENRRRADLARRAAA